MLSQPINFIDVVQSDIASDSDKKLYILDTNVLIHDPMALFQFEEHSLCLPLVVLEELDKHKSGNTELARSARQVTRTLAELLLFGSMAKGFDLAEASNGKATGKLFFFQNALKSTISQNLGFDSLKADNKILGCALHCLELGWPAVLVTKDVNLRVKALACGVPAQDYRSDRVLMTDEDLLPTGCIQVSEAFWDISLSREEGIDPFWRKGGKLHAKITDVLPINSFVIESREAAKPRTWRVESSDGTGSILSALSTRTTAAKAPLIKPRSDQQEMAYTLLTDDNVDVVTLLGPAGTGKTLLAVATGLEQVLQGKFKEVLITRATVSLGDEIGFLPGTEAEKMDAWLGGTLRDVYTALNIGESKELQSKVEVSSMSFMRGRSFQGKYIIIDEAQNLTTNQVRALLTRAGEGCKVVLTGNLAQIDTPYLDEGSSGLAWAVKTLQNWRHAGHLILTRGERSRLATFIEGAATK